MDNLTSLFGVVIGFYFASSAAVEYVKVKEGARSAAASTPKEPAPAAAVTGAPTESPNGQADLEAQVAALRAAVESLSQKVGQSSGT
jgi:hypothetical protein